MKASAQHLVRGLAVALLSAHVLSLGALGVESGKSIVLVPSDTVISSVQAVSRSGSPISITSSAAAGQYEVIYQDAQGRETSASVTAVDPQSDTYACINTGDGSSLRVRQGPGTGYSILCSVYDGNLFPVTGKTGAWYQIICNGRTGYVSSEFVTIKSSAEVFAPVEDVDYNADLGSQIVAYAMRYLGYPYIYATAGPDSFDCSGLTSYVYAHFGYSLNRSSRDQVKNGVAVSRDALRPGDLLFFSRDGSVITHVGLYIGGGEMIHASTATTGVIISDINSKYYINHYVTARRII